MPKQIILNPLSGQFDTISVVALTPVGSTPNPDGASIDANQNLTLQLADATNPGLMSSTEFNQLNSGSPNTFTGYSNAGTLESIPGWNFDNTSNGANVNLTYDPTVGSTTIQNFVSDFTPSANAASDESGFNFQTKYDGGHSGFDNAATITGTNISQVMSGNGTLDNQRTLIVDQHSGDGTSTGVVSDQNLIQAYSEVTTGSTVVDAAGLVLQLNQNGTMTGNYTGINASTNGQAIGVGLTGILFTGNCDVGAGSTLSQLTQNGAVGGDLNISSANNQGTIGNSYFGLNFANNGTIAQNHFFLNYNNQSSGSVGNDFYGSSINNQATVGHFFTGSQIINSNTVTKGFTGYNIDNTGNIGDGTGVSLNAFNVNLHGGSMAGGITGFNFSNSMPVTTNDNIFGMNANNTGAGYRFNGSSISNNANQTEEIRGFHFNSNGDARTITLADVNASGTVTDDFNGLRVTLGGTAQYANGIQVDLSSVNLSANNQKQGLSINDGVTNLNSNVFTSKFMPSGEWQHNYLGGQLHIESGFPISGAFGFGNNLGATVFAEDDMAADNTLGSSSIGYSINGFATQVAVTSGKTFDTLNFMFAGAGVSPQSTGGTFENVSMFRAAGLLPQGGSINVNNMYGFKAEPLLSSISPTNTWGVWIGDTNADNWFAKNVVIGGTTGQPETGQALDVTGPTRLRDLTTAGFVTTDANGHLSSSLSPPGSYQVDTFTLTPTDITNKFVTLSSAPTVPTATILTPVGGPMQSYGNDYTVSSNQLSWTGLFLDGVLASGDMLVVQSK